MSELSGIHGQEFNLKQSAVDKYGPGEDVVPYVAWTPFRFMARWMVTAMQEKIPGSESSFTPL